MLSAAPLALRTSSPSSEIPTHRMTRIAANTDVLETVEIANNELEGDPIG